MDNQIIQSYELSVWEDIAPSDGSKDYLDERKMAVIATNGYDAQIRAFNVALKENINGEKTLTFDILRRYRDGQGNLIDNPYITILTNERKLKLRIGEPYEFYDENQVYRPILAEEEDKKGIWLDFIIKTVDESKKDEKNTYTCKELFTTELGKNGYAITLADELENNYGNLNELAERILQNSGWEVGSSYIPKEYHKEQLFQLEDQTDDTEVKITQMIGKDPATLVVKIADLYVFASELKIDESDNKWHLKTNTPQVYYKNGGFTIDDADDDRVIIDESDKYNYISEGIRFSRTWVPLDTSLRGKKIIESNSTHYENVADKYVTDYTVISDKSGAKPNSIIYGYQEIDYLTSQTVQNYIVNSTNMSSTLGWISYGVEESLNKSYNIITYPKTDNGAEYSKNYLAVVPQKTKRLSLFNTGLEENNFKIIKGDKYILRIKARRINLNSAMTGTKASEIDVDNATKWKSEGGPDLTIGISNWVDMSKAPTFIDGMFRQLRHKRIDDTTDTASFLETRGYSLPIAKKENRHRYVEDELTSWYQDEQGYIWCVFKASESYGNKYGDNIGLLIQQPPWTKDKYTWCFEDIQFYPYMEQTYNGKTIPIFLNDIPSAAQLVKNYFYRIKNGVRYDLASNPDYYEPRKRSDYAAVRHIEVSKSNYFNNINNLAELFEVWVGFKVAHRKDGKMLRQNGKYKKQVIFSKYSPFDKENWAGFKYGINVEDIKRNTVSTEMATRTIVIPNNNEFATDGYCTIVRAIDNPSKENVIYNFDYYINQGLLSSSKVYNDFWNSNGINYYPLMNKYNNILLEVNQKIEALKGDLDINTELKDQWTAAAQSLENDIAEDTERYAEIKANNLENTTTGIALKTKIITAKAQLNKIKGTKNRDSEISKINKAIQNDQKLLYGKNGESGTYKSFWSSSVSYATDDIVRIDDVYYKALKQAYKINPITHRDRKDYWGVVDGGESAVIKESLVNKSNVYLDNKRRLESKLFLKYNRYIQEGTWESNDYVDDNIYYIDAKKVSDQSAFPKVTYTISVVDIGGIKKFAGYTFEVGERTYLEDTEFFGWVYKNYKGETDSGDVTWKTPYKKEVIISERTRNFDDPSKSTITIQTYRNQWKDLFSKLTAATQTLSFASGGYQRAANLVNESGQLKTNKVAEAMSGSNLNIITNNEGVKITSTGLTVKNLTKPTDLIKITGSTISITNDGGKTYKTAIDAANGINTSLLKAQQIDADLINITSSSSDYAFTWNRNGLNAFLKNASSKNKGTNNNVYVRFNNLGIFGTSKGEQIENALQQNPNANELKLINAIKDYTTFFLTWDGLYLNSEKGRVRLDPTTGLEIYGTNYWPNNTLSTYNYVFDADGNKYKNTDFIPLVSLGRQGLGYSGKGTKYGLRLRNNQGYITMETANDGNLLLRNQLQVGFDNDTISFNKKFEELVFISKVSQSVQKSDSTETHIENTYSFILNNAPVAGTKIDIYRSSNTNTLITSIDTNSSTWKRSNLSNGKVKFTIKKTKDTWDISTGYYLVTYTALQEATPFVGINGDGKTNSSNPIPLVLYAGYNAYSTNSLYYNESPFRLYADGSMVASNAQITGHINATSGIFSGAIKIGETAGINGNGEADYVFYAGDGSNPIPSFYVTPAGEMYGDSVHVTNGYFEGEITATTGTLKRLYFEEDAPVDKPSIISYIGLGETDSLAKNMTNDNRIFINIRGLNFVVDGMGNLFGETAYLSKNSDWDALLRSQRKDYPNINTSDKLKQLYNIIINGEDGNVLTVYNPRPKSKKIQDPNDVVLDVTKTGDIEMAGTLRAKNLFLKGNMLVSNGNNSISIDGETGVISGRGEFAGWRISADGDAEFENVKVRGTIAASVFEYDKITALGGILAITPSIYVLEDLSIENIDNDKGFIPNGLNDSGTWSVNDRVLINILDPEQQKEKYCYGIVKISEENELYIKLKSLENQDDLKDLETYIIEDLGINLKDIPKISDGEVEKITILPAGTMMINTNLNHNSIMLSSRNPLGSTIYMTARGGYKHVTMMGYLDPTKLNTQNANSLQALLEDNNNPQYGFYSDNAYLEGKVFLPSAGLTNETEYLPNDVKGKNYGSVRIWAGAPPQSKTTAPFIVTDKGYLFAKDGIFSGQIKAHNSEFSGTLKATGVILGPNASDHIGKTEDYEHFYFAWAPTHKKLLTYTENSAEIGNYILDINSRGLNLWNNLTVFSRYYSGYYLSDGKWAVHNTWEANGFSRYKINGNNTNEKNYWSLTENPYPLFTFIDRAEEKTTIYPRPVSMRLQLFAAEDSVFNTEEKTDLYGINFDGDKIKFVQADVSGKEKFYDVASAMWTAPASFTIGHSYIGGTNYTGINAIDFSLFNSQGPMLQLKNLGERKNIITMGYNLNDQINFGNKVRITLKNKGIAFTYIG